MSDREEKALRGVGGWLAVFVVILGVISPIRIIVTTWTSLYGEPDLAPTYGEVWPTLVAFEWTTVAVAVLITCFLAWRLIAVHVWRSVQMVIAGIWALAIGIQLVDAIGVSLIAGIPIANLLPAMGPEVVQPIVFCTVWTAYLLRSKRVANTYPRHAGADRAAEIFG